METSDAVVIGAGIIGAAVAYRLTERGLSVTILEAEAAPAAGSTGRSAAGVRVQFTSETNVRLSWASIREYRSFPDLFGEGAGYRDIGYLFLVPSSRWETHLEAVRLQRSLGVPVEVVDVGQARDIVDFVPHGVAGATYGPADGVVDPHAITMTYLRRARAAGARLRLGTPLLAARPTGDGWTITTPRGQVQAAVVVNAAGAWAGEVAGRAGLEVPVVPVRRMVFVTAPLGWEHRYPLTVDVASGFYLRSEGERVLFGRSNPQEAAGFHQGMDWSWLEPTAEAGMERFPWLSTAALDRRASWSGYYEVTPDHDAILGRMPGTSGWINACGFSGHGVQHAAAVGRCMAEEVVDGRAWYVDVDALRIDRFAGGRTPSEANIV